MRTISLLAPVLVPLALLVSCGGDPQEPKPGIGSRSLSVMASQDAAYEPLIQQLYLGFFGRPADPAGLAYHTQLFQDAGLPMTIVELARAYRTNGLVKRVVDGFAESEESKQLYPYCDWVGCDSTWVYALYQSLFSRRAETAGAEFWARALNARETTRANVLLAVLASAQGSDAALVERKIRVASRFTRAIDNAPQRNVYSGQLANVIIRSLIHSTPGLEGEAAIQAAIERSVAALEQLSSGTVEEVAPGSRELVLLASAERMADSADQLQELAQAMQRDLNNLRPGGPTWTVTVRQAAASVRAIREQLRGFDGVMLIGQLPVAVSRGAPFLDVYRVPNCPELQVDDHGVVVEGWNLHSADPRCQNGAVVSVLRGTSARAEPGELKAKLDQMIAYHKDSRTANASWLRRLRWIVAIWSGGFSAQPQDPSPLWSEIGMYSGQEMTHLNQGNALQRRDAFLDCLRSKDEICAAYLHGAPTFLSFEGPGTDGQFYSTDEVSWATWGLPPGFVKTKHVELIACSSQDFLHENSMGTSLLMRGDALLTSGAVAVVGIAGHYEEDLTRNEYALLRNGSTFAEAAYGRMEGTPRGFQGDPWITMRPPPSGPRPKLVIDGKHYNGGALSIPVDWPDAVGGADATRVISFSNRGDADLQIRIGSHISLNGVDYGTERGGEHEYGHNAQYEMRLTQVFSDGRVLDWPAFPIEINGGVMPVTLKPGASVAITYQLSVRTDADGKPKRPGLYTGQLAVMSDDPASARVYLEMRGRVR